MKKVLFLILFLSSIFAQTRVEDLQRETSSLNSGSLFVVTIPTDIVGTDTTWRTRTISAINWAAFIGDSVVITDTSIYVLKGPVDQTIAGNKTFGRDILSTENYGIKSTNFAPGLVSGSGFGIIVDAQQPFSSGYTGYLDNLYIRNNAFVNKYTINETQFSAGDFAVANGAIIDTVLSNVNSDRILTGDGDTVATTTASITTGRYTQRAVIKVHDPDERDQSPLKKGDIVEIKKHLKDGTLYQTIRGEIVRQDGRKLTINYTSGTLEAGDNIVSRGNTSDATRQNSMFFNINDANAPRIELYQGVNSVSKLISGSGRTAVIGNLNNIVTSEWGTLTGTGAYFPNGTLIAENGKFSGKLRIGTARDTISTTKLDAIVDPSIDVEAAKLGTTVIDGGYIITSLLTADNIQAGTLTGRTVRSSNGANKVELNNGDSFDIYLSSSLVCSIDGIAGGTVGGFTIPSGARASNSFYSPLLRSDEYVYIGGTSDDDKIAYYNYQGSPGAGVGWYTIEPSSVTSTKLSSIVTDYDNGVSGTFTTFSSITVTNGIITSWTP